MSSDAEAANARLATKRLRADIHRIITRWDPLSLKGLRGADRTYDTAVGPLLILVKRGEDKMVIARKLADLMEAEWGLPRDNAKCVAVAGKLHGLGEMYRGEAPGPEGA